MEIGFVRKVDIDQEMQQSYLDYAMSVIVARALPDARDGLKPVQRRILYAMQELNLNPGTAYKKSARIVGEVLGKFHPHGDMAVYEAMARMAQDFSMRYLLVDGQGNFGSIDGDPPAAMRYTEARMGRFASELMSQIDRDTVDFTDNFDGTLKEPVVLPAQVPNLLVNGASGIAVGMATSIPPHNLTEVVDALSYMLEHWDKLDDLGVEELMHFIKGPDFPTGGIILQQHGEGGIEAAYGSGRGRVMVRGRVHMEDLGRGRSRLIITELPYQTNKTTLIERIADLVREGTIEGIADLRDESDRQGMRIVIEISKAADAESLLRALYQKTPLQSTFGINLLALVDGEPRLLTLKQALRVFLEHRLTVVRRRSEYDLARTRARAHILEGLRVALKHLDEIIALIRAAPDAETARTRLMKRYTLSEIQAQAILDMQLRRLASLERKKIEDEYKEVTTQIKDLEALLKSPKRMRTVVEEELVGVKKTYGDRRRTQIVELKEGDSAATMLTTTDLTPATSVWVGMTASGLLGRSSGEALPDLSGENAPVCLLKATTHETLYLVSAAGQGAAIAVHALPEVTGFGGGAAFYKACALGEEDFPVAMFSTRPAAEEGEEPGFAVTVTRQGMVKKTALNELPGPSAQKFALVRVNAGDEVITLFPSDGKTELGLVTEQGMAIRFSEEEVRPMGLVAAGVMGIKVAEGDRVAAGFRWTGASELLAVAENGAAWRLSAGEFPLQGRYGQGVILARPAGMHLVAALPGGKSTAFLAHTGGGAFEITFGGVGLTKRGGRAVVLAEIRSGGGLKTVCALPAGALESRKGAVSHPDEKPAPKKRAASTGAGAKKPAQTAATPVKKGRTAAQTAPAAEPAGKKTKAKPETAAPGEKGVPAAPLTRKKSTPVAEAKPTTAARKPKTAQIPTAPSPGKKKSETPATVPAGRKKTGPAGGSTPAAQPVKKTGQTRPMEPAASPSGRKKPPSAAPTELPAKPKPAASGSRSKASSGGQSALPGLDGSEKKIKRNP